MPPSPPPINRARDLSDVAAGTPAKGDVLAHNGTAYAKLAVGSDGTVLTADAAQTTGVKWATPATVGGTTGQLLFNSGGTEAGVAGSSVSGADVTLGGDLTLGNTGGQLFFQSTAIGQVYGLEFNTTDGRAKLATSANGGLRVASDYKINWTAGASVGDATDLTLSRASASTLKVGDGGSGYGQIAGDWERLSAAPSAPDESRRYYDTTLHKARFFNGTAWETITSA